MEVTLEVKHCQEKIIRARYYWPSVLQYCAQFVSRCEKRQVFASFIHSPVELLHSVFSPWSFYQYGSYILGPFPVAVGHLKFLIVVIDYFTKWVEAEAVS